MRVDYTFIQKRFHPVTLSSSFGIYSSNPAFIPKQFHPSTHSSKILRLPKGGDQNDEMRHPLRAFNPPVQSTTHRTDHKITTNQPTLPIQDPTCYNPSHKTYSGPRESLHSAPSQPSSVLKSRFFQVACLRSPEDLHSTNPDRCLSEPVTTDPDHFRFQTAQCLKPEESFRSSG